MRNRHIAADMIADMHTNPCVSFWLKGALAEALNRDPVKALNDAEELVYVLKARLNEIQSIDINILS